MSSSEDKCKVPEDKHKDRRKKEYFRRSDILGRGQKGKKVNRLRRTI